MGKKKRAKKKNIKIVEKKQEIYLVICMRERNNMKLCIPVVREDQDIIKLQEIARSEKEELKRRYYKTNISISKTEKRTLVDLVKRYIEITYGKSAKLVMAKK